MRRPLVHLKAAMSLDGFISGAGPERLILSSAEDVAAVDALRASVDAILIGAQTLRHDDPRLLVRDPAHTRRRQQDGRPAQPTRVVCTESGQIPLGARLFAEASPVWIVAPAHVAAPAGLPRHVRWHGVPAAPDAWLIAALEALATGGIGTLLVEGGARVHRAFAAHGAFDTLRLAIAPRCVGAGGVRLFDEQAPSWGRQPLTLERAEALGDTAVLHYRRGSPPER